VQFQHYLERIRAGDLSARDELLRGFGTRLESLARNMLRHCPQVQRRAESADALQDALLRLPRSLQDVTAGSDRELLGLIAVEMRGELLALAQQFYGLLGLGANHATQATVADQPAPDPVPAAEDDSNDLGRWQAFHEGVDGLPPDEREVLSLVFYHGWTQAEAAELLQTSDWTIRRRWESALLKLHERLGLHGHDT
jgi:RNA polymerase sigma-70 factor (ECF subfamily)